MTLKDKELPADEDDLKKDEEVRLKILNWIETDHPQLITIAEGLLYRLIMLILIFVWFQMANSKRKEKLR